MLLKRSVQKASKKRIHTLVSGFASFEEIGMNSIYGYFCNSNETSCDAIDFDIHDFNLLRRLDNGWKGSWPIFSLYWPIAFVNSSWDIILYIKLIKKDELSNGYERGMYFLVAK